MALNFEELLNNPMFTMGAGLLGGASPRNSGILNAFQLMQQQRRMQMEAEQHKQQQEAQKAMLEQRAAATAAQQAQTAAALRKTALEERKYDNLSAAQVESRSMFQGLLGPYGFGLGQDQQPSPPAQPAPQGMPQSAPQPAPPTSLPSSFFPRVDDFVVRNLERTPDGNGTVANDAGKGLTIDGVNQSAHPDFDLKNSTPEQRAALRQSYWKAIDGDNLPFATAAVGYDAAINQGQSYAKRLLEKTGGDPALMLAQREKDYEELSKSHPLYEQYLPSWKNRIAKLRKHVNLESPPPPTMRSVSQQSGMQPNKPQSGIQLEPHQVARVAAAKAALDTGELPKAFEYLSQALEPTKVDPGQFVVTPRGTIEYPNRPQELRERQYREEVDRAQETVFAKGYAEKFFKAHEEAAKASSRIQRLNLQEDLMNRFATGKLTPAMTEGRLWLKTLGLEVDPSTPAAQAAKIIGDTMAMDLRDPSQGSGSPGAITEWEAKTFQRLTANIDKDPASNKILIGAYRKLQQRHVEVARIYREHRDKNGGRITPEVEKEIAAYMASNPIFDSKEIDGILGANQPVPKGKRRPLSSFDR